MKKILLFVVLCLGYGFLNAQPPPPGSYTRNNDIDKLVGTWKWVCGNEEIVMKFEKFRHTVANFDEDILLGSHSYIKNGVLVESSMSDFAIIPANHRKSTLYIYHKEGGTTNQFMGTFRDITKKKTLEITALYIPGTTRTLVWHFGIMEGAYIREDFQYGMTFPGDILLLKQ